MASGINFGLYNIVSDVSSIYLAFFQNHMKATVASFVTYLFNWKKKGEEER